MTLFQNIVAGAIAYVVYTTVVIAVFLVGWLVVGAEGAFRPGSWEVSWIWVGSTFIAVMLSGASGGWLCTRLAADRRGVWITIGLIFGLNALNALTSAETTSVRPGDTSVLDAIAFANQPAWMLWSSLVLGVVCVWLSSQKSRASR